ncbi:SDR family NAD(P)-dependent oxidoreductase [Pseudarthrobacter oxydans]|uniref:SDR family NAD(P)-dependent oxidoreductase n=1 Tax=Pseudarthrobacter oxydans TaxID=1671 RepID=UPI003D270495
MEVAICIATRRTIVTGAARGQGEAHVQLFALEGASVLISDALDDLGEALASELREAGSDVDYLQLNVSSEESP